MSFSILKLQNRRESNANSNLRNKYSESKLPKNNLIKYIDKFYITLLWTINQDADFIVVVTMKVYWFDNGSAYQKCSNTY